MCTTGSDQVAIQRYLVTRDALTARRTLLVSLSSDVVVLFFLLVFFAIFTRRVTVTGTWIGAVVSIATVLVINFWDSFFTIDGPGMLWIMSGGFTAGAIAGLLASSLESARSG